MQRFRELVQSTHARRFWHVFAGLVLYFGTYRAVLWWEIAHTDAPPRSMAWAKFDWQEIVLVSSNDVHFIIVFSLLVVLGGWLARRWPAWVRALGLAPALLLLGIISAAHLRLLFSLGEGFDVIALAEFTGVRNVHDIVGYSHLVDWMLVVLPALLVLPPWPSTLRLVRNAAVVSFIVLVYVLAATTYHPSSYWRAIWRCPPVHLAFRAVKALDVPRKHLALERPVSEVMAHRMLATDPPFTAEPIPGPGLPSEHATNVLVVIMESVGASYVQDLSPGEPDPMPHLRALGERGLMLAEHNSTANTSIRGVFSVMSGLYPLPRRQYFSNREDAVVPSITAFLGPEADCFLYTPGRLQSFFPSRFLKNSGMDEILGFDRLKAMGVKKWAKNGRHEGSSVDAFIERMDRASEPFVGVYYSYVPHFWYQDQGPEWRLLPDISLRYNRYINGMWYLDHLVQRMIDALDASGRLDDTVVVITGDHGQAFGQHDGNYTHGRRTYQENIRVPAVILGPGIEPRRVDFPTSHVDLAPTVLDALGVDYEPLLFQGQSLFRDRTIRHVFAVGSENALVAIDRDRRKVRISYSSDKCRAWDLASDPGEKHKIPCDEYDDLRQALVDWRGFQLEALIRYNEALKKGEPFGRLQHPRSTAEDGGY